MLQICIVDLLVKVYVADLYAFDIMPNNLVMDCSMVGCWRGGDKHMQDGALCIN